MTDELTETTDMTDNDITSDETVANPVDLLPVGNTDVLAEAAEHDDESSPPVQQPSPQVARQSAAQPHASSECVQQPSPHTAVQSVSRGLAKVLSGTQVTVNAILPGTIDTPPNRKEMPNADHDKWVPTAALADVILFLCSDASRCVTGAAIPVFGQS